MFGGILFTHNTNCQDISKYYFQNKKRILISEKFISHFQNKQYDSMLIFCNELMKNKMDSELLSEVYQNILQWGEEFKEIIWDSIRQKGEYWVHSSRVVMKKTNFKCEIVYDQDSISGFFFKPIHTSSEYKIPDYVQLNHFHEVKLTVPGPVPLYGMLTIPSFSKGPFAVIILSWGSGPLDMNEEVGATRIFQDLAWGLASQGIAVFRFPKRTFVKEDYINTHPKMTLKEEYLEDIHAAVKILKKRKDIHPQKIIYLGHSLGAGIMPWIMQNELAFSASIALAAPFRQLYEIIPEQLEYLMPDSIFKQNPIKIKSLYSVKLISQFPVNDSNSSETLPMGLPPSYWNHYHQNIVPEMALKMNKPALWIQGERDYQVNYSEFLKWKSLLSLKSNHYFYSYPALNHLMISGKGLSLPAEYNQPGNIDYEVIKDITKFINHVIPER